MPSLKTRSPEYGVWVHIKQRCYNQNSNSYKNYGAKGVTICKEWLNDSQAFLDYIGKRPSPKHSLDRINKNKGYEPGNIKWLPPVKEWINKFPNYATWLGIKYRCYNSNSKDYIHYGGRGIKVYDGWINNFTAFNDYVGEKPSADYSLDRIDNNGNYEPGNVRWATRHEQMANMRNNAKTVGVNYDKRRNKWLAVLMVGKRHVIHKYFNSYDDAVSDRKQAEQKYLAKT